MSDSSAADDTGPGEEAAAGGRWRERVDKFSTWRTEIGREAALLPQTLADLRQTITDLKRVSARLERATEGIEVLLNRAESSGLAPLARQLDAAVTEMESQLRAVQSQLPGGDLVNQAMDDLARQLDAFTSLLPKPRPRE